MAPTAPKNPSNADIYRKLDHMDIRIANLENWKIAEDAAKKAIAEYKSGEDRGKRSRLVTNLGSFLIALTLLIYLIIQHFSGK